MAASSSSSWTSLFLLILLLGSALYIGNATSGLPELPNLTTLSFEEGYTQLFGDSNLMLHGDGRNVHISLDQRTGAGFASQDLYLHGFFSGSIKLPSDYAAGVVVAFDMSNGDIFEKTHDELDFEFLGNIRGREWRVQTNIYGNGSISTGREERYELWFDPTEDYHQYSILWSSERIIFYIDNIPIRELVKSQTMGGDYPAKPMSLYATIWDGSTWATSGGRYKVNYKFAPYTAEFADLVLHGCAANPTDHKPICMGKDDVYNGITMPADQRLLMEKFRKKRITYSYCHDRIRYPTPPPECILGPEAEGFLASGEAKFSYRRRHGRRYARSSVGVSF